MRSLRTGTVHSSSLAQQMTKNIVKIKDTIINEATGSIGAIASSLSSRAENSGADKRQQEAFDSIKGLADDGKAQLVNTLGGGVDIFKQLVDMFQNQFIGRFMNIVDKTMEKQNMLSQMTQNGLLAKRGQIEELDNIVNKLGDSLKSTIINSRSLKKLGSDKIEQLLVIVKTFTKKLKDITKDLVSRIKIDEKKKN